MGGGFRAHGFELRLGGLVVLLVALALLLRLCALLALTEPLAGGKAGADRDVWRLVMGERRASQEVVRFPWLRDVSGELVSLAR